MRKIKYISSHGAQYIDTGFKPNSMCTVEIKAKINNALSTSWDTLFGTRNGVQSRFTLRFSNPTNGNINAQKSATDTSSPYLDYEDYYIVKNSTAFGWHTYQLGQTYKVDGDVVSSVFNTSSTAQFTYNLFLFTVNDGGVPGYGDYAYADVAYCKIWDENGVLVRHFVGAIDDNDVVCMYDEVNGTYYYNAGTGAFTANPEEPDYYEYASFAGGHQIQLPYTLNGDYMVTVDFQMPTYINDQHVIGNSGKNNIGYYYSHLTEYNNNWYTSTGETEGNFLSTNYPTENRHVFVSNKNQKNWMDRNEVTNYTPYTDATIFYRVGGREGSSWNFRGKIWSYRLERISDGTVLCNLRPAKDATHEGLYDTVNDVWYTGGITVYNKISNRKHLLESNGNYFTIVNNALTNIGSTLNAQLFADYGMDAIPDWSEYSTLSNPSILCWDAEDFVDMVATTEGLPSPQTVTSSGISLIVAGTDGIDSVSIEDSGSPTYAFSVDDGTTWKIWSGSAWLASSGTDMSGADVEALTKEEWDLLTEGETFIKVKFTLTADTDAVESITITYARA